ncbi:MAG: FMN-binding negative transcriptional regulator [Bacteroidia bacterium]|nr:FMN-binding negative transcriptional regulator [Bacteroidia bacterium]
MYVPPRFQEQDWEKQAAFIRANSFGQLVTTEQGLPVVTHLPLELELHPDGYPVLLGHISRANPQGQAIVAGERALAVFHGPHAYVSSSWYEAENVPTWNYIAVHVYGTLRLLGDDELLAALGRITDRYEAGRPGAVSVSRMSPAYVTRQLRGVWGFELRVEDVQAQYKLSQNRHDADHEHIISHLAASGDAQAAAIAAAMAENRPPA